jgi:hypothetical protein
MVRLIVFIASLICSLSVFGDVSSTPRSSIVVENRVLATVRDQVITVIDVMKKLDLIFYQQFPQYRGMPEARYEFYRSNWRKVFEELVDRQLIHSLAEEKQFTVTNGDIREELEEAFGPNVMMNLYEEGLSMHEVHEMMKADILLRRIISFYVHTPVMSLITPEVLRAAYQTKIEELKGRKGFIWRSVTIRAKGKDCPKEEANKIWKLLEKDRQSIESIESTRPEGIECTVSQPFKSEQREVSPVVLKTLEKLPLHSFSEPVAVTCRSDPHQSWKCYIVDECFDQQPPTFLELEATLRQELATPEVAKRTIAFFDDLRNQYHVKHIFSSEELLAFEPFQLKQK